MNERSSPRTAAAAAAALGVVD